MIGRIGLVVLFAFYSNGVMAEQEMVKKSREYVSNLNETCSLDDGYVCIEVEEDDFLVRNDERILIPGPYLQAWTVAYADFQTIKEMNDEQKALRHYKIGFTENKEEIIVYFGALLLPRIVDGKPQGVIRPTFGLPTKYWIEKQSLKIKKRLFLK